LDFSVKNISSHEANSDYSETAARFSELGGTFLTDVSELSKRLEAVRVLVFDWDGVFNKGAKGQGTSSGFSEADSMGTNMLRYGLWRRNGDLPITVIITGENNPTAEHFATREHFHAIYSGVANKAEVIGQLCATYRIEQTQIACVFDDINDLGMAAECGARFLVRRNSSPLLQDFVSRNQYCDYITAAEAGGYAVREIAELILGLMGVFDAVVSSRTGHDADYKEYFSTRQAVVTQQERNPAT
jgi:3-deoxy-D-manno-octulosonate 8-phosphate phosphatase (KDO 8-P phosphatase)